MDLLHSEYAYILIKVTEMSINKMDLLHSEYAKIKKRTLFLRTWRNWVIFFLKNT